MQVEYRLIFFALCYLLLLNRNVRWSLLSLFALFDLPSSLQNRLLHLICSIPDDEPVTGNELFHRIFFLLIIEDFLFRCSGN